MTTTDPIKLKEKRKRYYLKHRLESIAQSRQWRKKNKEKARDTRNRWERDIRRSLERRPLWMFRMIKNRINSNKKIYRTYDTRKVLFTRDEFVAWVLSQQAYHQLFKKWEQSDFHRALVPTVDRIDNGGHYEFGNIQILTQKENGQKSNLMR